MKIYLIRHGKTIANEQHLYCGSTDLPLSENGIRALEQIEYDMNIKNTAFVTSGMKRTEETLKILFGDVKHTIDSRFREIDFGIFEMKGYNELKDNVEYQNWISGDNYKNIPPKGESGRQMAERVLEAFEQVKLSGKDIVIVTHGGVISAVMEYYFKDENKNRYQWQPQCGHGYLIENDRYTVL